MNTTPSGLQFEDSVEGDGKQAAAGHDATVHYTGWLWVDGARAAKFDSSHDRRQPFEFELGAGMVIRGWDEGVQGMKVGGRRTLIVPAALGYGARGAGGVIPPNATLCFEVELLGLAGGPEPVTLDLQTTPSGLQYEDRAVGSGAEAVAGRQVSVHYTGWLYQDGMKGKKFDSSKDRGQPFGFRLGGGEVIQGWDEGVQGMKVGGTRLLLLPPDLAYGEYGAGGVIPPDATLLFEVELLAA